jgi:hypothetical protein
MFSVTSPSSISWNWITEYKLAVTENPLGAGTVQKTPDACWFQTDEIVGLTAAAESGFTFSSWTGDPVTNPDDPDTPETVRITMDGPKSVIANFSGDATICTFTVNPCPHGTPDPPVGTHDCVQGTEITASVDEAVDYGAGTRYRCARCTGTGSCPSSSQASVTFTMFQNSTVTWEWQTEYLLITNSSPAGAGTVVRVPDSDWYEEGKEVTLTADPEQGFAFLNWSGGLTSTSITDKITMSGLKSVTANFSGSGTFCTLAVNSLYGSPDPPVGVHNVIRGTQVTVSVPSPIEIAGTRYTCTGWIAGYGDIPPDGSATSYTIHAIGHDSGITWDWALSFLLTTSVSPSRAGTVTRFDESGNPTSQMWFEPGTIITLTARPAYASVYSFAYWSGDISSAANPVTVIMNRPITATANFSLPPTREWNDKTPPGGVSERPQARSGHAMVYSTFPELVLLFGGIANYVCQNDTWVWDGAQWTKINVAGSIPSARYGHCLAYDSARAVAVLFGGYDQDGNRLGDTWEYNVATGSWTNVTSLLPISPTPRYYAAMAYDPARNEVVLFGGYLSTDVARSDDTWVYKVTGGFRTWSKKDPSKHPPASNAAAMVYDYSRNAIILHGGQVGSAQGYGASSKETWEWNGSNWASVSTAGPSISWHAMASNPFMRVTLLFGGWEGGYDGSRKNETWEWSGSTWTKRTPPGNPGKREMHAMAYDEKRGEWVMFGGSAFVGPLNDTWTWNGAKWRDPISNPLPTEGCTLTYDSGRNNCVLFGGEVTSPLLMPTNATWIWYDDAWTQPPLSTSPPPARQWHAAAFDAVRQETVIFGGWDSYGSLLNDTWTFTLDASGVGNWTQKSPADSPTQRYSHAMAYDSNRQRVVLFGGWGSDGVTNKYLNDTYEWNGTNWTQRFPSVSPGGRYCHAMAYDSNRQRVVLFGGYDGTADKNDTWEWNGNDWTQTLNDSPLHGPGARSCHAMAYDSSRLVVVLFGGSSTEYLSDTWEYNGTGWTLVSTGADHPSARHLHAMCFNAFSGLTVLFGGFFSQLTPVPVQRWFDDTWEY